MTRSILPVVLALLVQACAANPTPQTAATSAVAQAGARTEPDFARQSLDKQLVDLQFFIQLSPTMVVRKVQYAGGDDMVIPAYLFAPKDTTGVKYPTVILVHDGIHGDLGLTYMRIVRGLVGQGYVVLAPEYRGSTGYGPQHYNAIDYGGKEVDDVLRGRDYLAALVPFADLSRLGIMGWSHGGFITLHSIFRTPEWFKVAVAHVPVADLPTRMRTHEAAYQQLFAQQKGFGGTLEQNPAPYIQRSPIAHVRELKTPVLVHTAGNDRDVFIIENHNLRDSMVAAGKDREGLYHYREWPAPPGGHEFARYETVEAYESWRETLSFLAKYLK